MAALRGALARGEIDRATAIDELRTLLIAGHETSATAMAWAVALLAKHRELAVSLRREGELANRITTIAQLGELELTERCAKEVLRLYPAVPLAIAQAVTDVRLGHIEVPRGTRIDLSCYVQHRLPWHWPEPQHFDPDRFLRPPSFGTYLPFSLGPHTCLGMQCDDRAAAVARTAGDELRVRTARRSTAAESPDLAASRRAHGRLSTDRPMI